jgi:hypothetical protein
VNDELSALRVLRPLPRGLCLTGMATFGLALAGCASTSPSTPPGTASSISVAGQGFRLVLPSGWTASPPSTSNGYTTYAVQPTTSGLEATIATLPIPSDPTNPRVVAITNDDIVTLALTINGTTGAQPQLTESAHVVTFAGESCARMGLATGSGGDSRSITCRRNQVIYVVLVSSSSPSSQLISTLEAIATDWSWA